MATDTNTDKLAKRLAPVIRRGMLVGSADSIALLAMLPREAEQEIWATELTRESDPDALAYEAACAAEDESAANGATRFRVACRCEGQSVAELVFRTRPEKESSDVIGRELLPKGETSETAMVRMLMRHSENASRIALGSVERREGVMLDTMERLMRSNQDLLAKYMEQIKLNADAMKQEREHEIMLLQEDMKNTAIREGITLVKQVAPRLIAKLSGDDVVGPLVPLLRKLDREQISALVSSGMLTEEEGRALGVACEKARKAATPPAPPPAPKLPNGGKAS